MARSWREYGTAAARDKRDNSDISPAPEPFVPIVTNVTGLPDVVRIGLDQLQRAPAPPLVDASLWPQVVADAVALAVDGWAATALKLSWSPLDLFGAVCSKSGDPISDGLVVKLGGRRILALCSSFATVENGAGRVWLYRGNTEGASLLWDLGRG